MLFFYILSRLSILLHTVFTGFLIHLCFYLYLNLYYYLCMHITIHTLPSVYKQMTYIIIYYNIYNIVYKQKTIKADDFWKILHFFDDFFLFLFHA